MRNGFRQSTAWLHTWSGLILGWLMFSIFVTGTASYYRDDISLWMRPELSRTAEPDAAALGRAAEAGQRYLDAHAGDAFGWSILLPRADSPLTGLSWRDRPGPASGQARLDPETGAPSPARETRGGDFLYRFHFELNLPPAWGRWIVGAASMAMLVALLSGIVTHRRIFADFFTFRRAKSAQRGWLDAHNVAGVLALPFHLMITYTGLVTLAVTYMPWGIASAYRGDAPAFFAEGGHFLRPREPAGRPGTLVPLAPLVEQAQRTTPEPLALLVVNHPRDANATVSAYFEEPHGLAHQHPQIVFDGTTGEVLQSSTALKPAGRTFATMVGLHEAHFAEPVLRALFFLCGVMGSAMVATGLILWSVARLPKPGEGAGVGHRIVEALNLGVVAGLPAALAAYFLANRLVPADLVGRAEWEVRAFFGAWLLVALLGMAAAFRVGSRRQAWRTLLLVPAALYAAVPVADIALTGRLVPARTDATALWFDGAMIALAVLFGFAAQAAAARDRAAGREADRERPKPAALAKS